MSFGLAGGRGVPGGGRRGKGRSGMYEGKIDLLFNKYVFFVCVTKRFGELDMVILPL